MVPRDTCGGRGNVTMHVLVMCYMYSFLHSRMWSHQSRAVLRPPLSPSQVPPHGPGWRRVRRLHPLTPRSPLQGRAAGRSGHSRGQNHWINWRVSLYFKCVCVCMCEWSYYTEGQLQLIGESEVKGEAETSKKKRQQSRPRRKAPPPPMEVRHLNVDNWLIYHSCTLFL